ncbi:MAG: DUF4097 family beta strand repeat protein [Clostridia bacterium]|nr:DUF4097 family beta strand repeat protein [Clostridia bacterium]
MRKAMIIATVLVVVGLILFAGAMTANGWDFTKLSTVSPVTNSYEVSGFDKISIDIDTAELVFVPTDEAVCRVVCYEQEKVQHTVTVQDGTLCISRVDTRKWYEHIGIFFDEFRVTVSLPKTVYAALKIDTHTGNVTIPQGLTFGVLEVKGSTADVSCLAAVSERLSIVTSTGDILVDGLTVDEVALSTTTGNVRMQSTEVKGRVDVEVNTGDVRLTKVACETLEVDSDTGKQWLKDVVVSGALSLESDTGDVRLTGCDGAQITIETDTGDVTGTLLTDKVFITETSTGRIQVPKTTTGGRCEITTSTGDISITIQPA